MSPRRAERGVLHYLLLGINAGIFALVAAIAALVLIIPAATGSVALTVLTGSMEPGLPPGSLVVVRPTDPADVRIGSIVTYQWEPGRPTLVTHRVTEVVSNSDGTFSWTTQGDNNADPDPNPVTQEQLQGVVWYSLPLVGWVSNLVAGDLRPILVPVIGGALLVYAAVLVVQSLRGKRTSGSGGADAVAERARGRRSRVAQGRRSAGAEPTGRAEPAAPVAPLAPIHPVEEPVPTSMEASPDSAVEPEPTAAPVRGRRREPSGTPAPGPRRSTWIEPEPAEAPAGRRARRAAERAAAEGAGTGLDSFIDPVPYPEPEEAPEPPRRPRGRGRSYR